MGPIGIATCSLLQCAHEYSFTVCKGPLHPVILGLTFARF